MTCKPKPTLLTLSCFLEGEIFVSNSNREVGVFWFQSNQRRMNLKSCHIKLIVYNIYEAVFIFHFYVINIVPAPRAQGAHPHTPKATQICELDLEFDQGLFTLLICLSVKPVKTVSQVSKQQSVTVVSVKSQVEFYFSSQNIRQCQITSMCSADWIQRGNYFREIVLRFTTKKADVSKKTINARARFAGFFFREIDFSVDKYSRG